MSQGDRWRDPLPQAAATFWGSLAAADRLALYATGTVRSFARGWLLCREGHEPAGVFVIYSGGVEVYRDDPAGHRTVLARRGPGDLIGEISAVDGRTMSATVSVIEPTAALVVAPSRFADLCRSRPQIAWLVLESAVARLRDSDTHRAGHRTDIRQRTIRSLLELAERDPVARDQPVVLRLTQQDLADAVPAALVSVTRVLEELRHDGAISTGRGRIVVHDIDALRRLLAADSR
ncbi:MAG TPA: Crp/Fnr family transcriptional regulator [Mycobacteriales bacterium]|nr:Crp/Fnr family transcriptional regulator [Mycobacteriales bacterium]